MTAQTAHCALCPMPPCPPLMEVVFETKIVLLRIVEVMVEVVVDEVTDEKGKDMEQHRDGHAVADPC